MDLKEIYDLVCDDIDDRSVWAEMQNLWYKTRVTGIRRARKPWPTASDMHYPLADGTIDNWKPFYTQQLFSTELIADFTGEPGMPDEVIQESAYWFDYKIKECSNLEEQLSFGDDHMLVYSRGIIKNTWDYKAKKLHFTAIEPLHIIVPSDTVTLDEATRITHVKHLSVWEYKNGKDSKKYKKDKEFIKSITGGPDTDTDPSYESKKLARGITHTDDKIIIIWETWVKTDDGNWEVHTYSPQRPQDYVRPTFKCPYKLPDGTHPFTDFFIESRQGYYEARGLCELLTEFEQSLNKMWNEKLDCMTLYNRPILSATRDIPNIGNIRLGPGQILPFEVRATQTGAPPISFDEEMRNTRAVAQARVSVPDFGTQDQVYSGQQKSSKTATEIDAIMGVQNMMVNQRSRTYRRRLSRLYSIAWALLVQYDKSFDYIKDSQQFFLSDEKVIQSIVSITPAGTSESWDQHKRFQKSVVRLQQYRGDPFINQGELRKSSLELDEPGLVSRLYVDPGDMKRRQAEMQMIELCALEAGMPITPTPDDDHAVHLDTIIARATQMLQTSNKPPDPRGIKPTQDHIVGHMQMLGQMDGKLVGQYQQKLEALGKQVMAKQQAMMAQGPRPILPPGVVPPGLPPGAIPPRGPVGPPPAAPLAVRPPVGPPVV